MYIYIHLIHINISRNLLISAVIFVFQLVILKIIDVMNLTLRGASI